VTRRSPAPTMRPTLKRFAFGCATRQACEETRVRTRSCAEMRTGSFVYTNRGFSSREQGAFCALTGIKFPACAGGAEFPGFRSRATATNPAYAGLRLTTQSGTVGPIPQRQRTWRQALAAGPASRADRRRAEEAPDGLLGRAPARPRSRKSGLGSTSNRDRPASDWRQAAIVSLLGRRRA